MTAIWFCWHQRDKNFLEHTDVAWDANNPIRQSNHPVLNIAVLYFYLIPSSTLLTFLILESRLLDKKVVNDCYRIGIHHASTRPVKVNSLSSNPTVPSTAASLHNPNSSFSTCCLNIFMLIFNVFYHLWQDLDQYSYFEAAVIYFLSLLEMICSPIRCLLLLLFMKSRSHEDVFFHY